MDAKAYAWAEVPLEEVTPTFARQLVWGGRSMVARLHLKPGCEVPAHQHDNEQVSVVLRGRIHFWLGAEGERELDLGPGEVLVIPGGTVHRAVVLEDFEGLDVFSPPRQDWIEGTDAYLRQAQK